MLSFLHRKGGFVNFQRMLTGFVRINLVVLVVLLILRASQLISLSFLHSLPADAWLLEFSGFMQDVVLWLNLSWFLLIPFILFSLMGKRAGMFLFSLVFLTVAMLEWALFLYFQITLTPLDQVVFSYTTREMILIARNSVQIDFFTFLPFIVLVLLTALLIRISQKVNLHRMVLLLFFLVSFGALFLRKSTTPRMADHRNRFEYYLTTNKSAYLIEKLNQYRSSSAQTATIFSVKAAALRYHAAHPEFEYSGTGFPFLHYDHTPDVLSPFFNLGKEKPNLVFIVVESLSSCFMGNSSIFGSFTPFLDSLALHSLYWNNCLSSADRTFNVLPALFSSLPPGDPTFINEVSKIPYHLSLIRYLHENGYYTSFFYAGDPKFNYMEDYLQRQEIDYILRSFGPKFRKVRALTDGYHWGHSDADLYTRSFEVIDSLHQSPRLDIYLTLSLHSPFIPPNEDLYLSQVDKRLKTLGTETRKRSDIEHYKNIFATILYTDHALKEFMDSYQKRPGYQNTIFIITGDHGLPELNLDRFSGLARFNVPLIIFSPMLKQGVFMESVSSHLDVTPTILAMMRERYHIKTRPIAPWIGSGIDTAAAPRNIHTLPFILNNKEILEYVDHSYYLFRDKLSRILPDLRLKDTTCPAVQRRMMSELADFKILNTYVTKQNKLIPPEIYFRKVLDSVDVTISDPILFSPTDPPDEFRYFFKKLPINSKIKFLKLEVRMDILTQETDSKKDPELVFELNGNNGKQLAWQSFDFPCHTDNPAKPGEWRTLYLREYVDLSYLHSVNNYSLVLYLWNKAHCADMFDNSNVKITGYF
jgi:phosphoglycerol transferase MdoB-like AlkP superfamily enzyme